MTYDSNRPGLRGRAGGSDTLALLAAGGLVGLAAYAYYETRGRNQVEWRPDDDAPRRTARIRDTRSRAGQGRTVTIGKPRSEVWAFFRDLTNLPKFMENLISVETMADRTRWTAIGPHGGDVTFETETVEEREGELYAWRTVPGARVPMEGRVSFRDAPAGRGTEVTGLVRYSPPGGRLGHAGAKLTGRDPRTQVRRELKRLKMLMETGEVATSANRRTS